MSRANRMADDQAVFFQALVGAVTPAGLKGRFEIYRYAYFERIRGSIEEDYPSLFEFLEAIEDFPGGIDSEVVTHDLLIRNHPRSWTLAEASVPILESVEALLAGPKWTLARAEAKRLALLDESESYSAWLEEWPEPKSAKSGWVAEFAAERLSLVRTKTWREAGETIFWRNDSGVQRAVGADFAKYAALLPLVEIPILFPEFALRAADAGEPGLISVFLERGIAEGWLKLVPMASIQ
jgi:hypothetical protein